MFSAMTTLIVRLADDPAGGLKGTVEEPGGPSHVFRSADELLSVLSGWSVQDGNGLGSTSNSAIRET